MADLIPGIIVPIIVPIFVNPHRCPDHCPDHRRIPLLDPVPDEQSCA